MNESPLVTTQWLQDHLGDPNLRILEVCSLTDDKVYREGHVPGAQWVYWKAACWHETDRQFISSAAMARLFRHLPEALKHDMARRLKRKVMMGTDHPAMPPDRWLASFYELGLSQEVQELILWRNAVEIYRLHDRIPSDVEFVVGPTNAG